MKNVSDAHLHSTYSDGGNTPREIVEEAIKIGFTGLGFSDHSPAPFDESCLGVFGKEKEYQQEIFNLKKEYEGRLNILCGIEQDFDGTIDKTEYDYIIGSVHYLPDSKGNLAAIDMGTTAQLQTIWCEAFNGDSDALYQAYYDKVVENVRKYHPDIVGHFDLIVKRNADNILFNEDSEKYKKYALQSLDAVIDETLSYGGIIEMNTGGISRGYKTSPYPDTFLLERLAKRGANIMINSDSHRKEHLGYGFDDSLERAKKAGFKTIFIVGKNGFEEIEIAGS